MLFVVNFFISPFNLTISFTNFDEIIWFSTSDIKKIVSMFWFNFLFMPANWNSYSKSDTALNPLRIIKLSGEEKVVSAIKIDDNLI